MVVDVILMVCEIVFVVVVVVGDELRFFKFDVVLLWLDGLIDGFFVCCFWGRGFFFVGELKRYVLLILVLVVLILVGIGERVGRKLDLIFLRCLWIVFLEMELLGIWFVFIVILFR